MKDEKRAKNQSRKVFAKKSLGQNFLVDQNYIDKIISALNPQIGETIIEIGAGRGALTEKLVESGANIVAVELDRNLIPLLDERFGKEENFKLIEQNALEINFADIIPSPESETQNTKSVKLIGNLPYYISTAILQKLAEQSSMFTEIILMLQREVVERITAQPGNKERGFLTVLVEVEFNAEKLFDVPPTVFLPAPKVWSSVVRLISKDFDKEEVLAKKLFRQIVSSGFIQKRKTILNNLKNAPGELGEKFEKKGGVSQTFERLNIAPIRRAETLTIDEWKSLCRFLSDET